MIPHSGFGAAFLDRFLIESANRPRRQGYESEDYVLIDSSSGLLGVFDSVGGRDRGQFVAHLAGETIMSVWQALPKFERQGAPARIEVILQALIRQADTAIASLILPAEQKRPATTVALGVLSVQFTEAYLTVAHIGDSRVYLLRGNHPLQRLTEDDGYFSFAVHRGMLTREESRHIEQAERANELTPGEQAHFARRNEITCAVGWTDFPRIQACSLPLCRGDLLLFSTDGVHDNLSDREIEGLLRRSHRGGAQRLVRTASERSLQTHFRAKRDDVSAIVIQYQ